MLDMNRLFTKNDQILFKVIGGEPVLVDPYRRELMRLNPVASETWELLDGKRSLGQIIDAVKENFDADEGVVRRDVMDFIKELVSLEIIR